MDPKRCRPWKYHNRTNAWYTKERCQDLIDSIVKDGQLEPALARKLTGDPDLTSSSSTACGGGSRPNLHIPSSKLRLTDADDAKAAVLMHIENADRQDITPMERALSFQQQLEAKIFATQDAMAEAFGLSKAQVTKLLKAAQLLKQTTIGQLFADRERRAGGGRLSAGGVDGPAGGQGCGSEVGAEFARERRERTDTGGHSEGAGELVGSVAARGADEAGVSRGTCDPHDGGHA